MLFSTASVSFSSLAGGGPAMATIRLLLLRPRRPILSLGLNFMEEEEEILGVRGTALFDGKMTVLGTVDVVAIEAAIWELEG